MIFLCEFFVSLCLCGNIFFAAKTPRRKEDIKPFVKSFIYNNKNQKLFH